MTPRTFRPLAAAVAMASALAFAAPTFAQQQDQQDQSGQARVIQQNGPEFQIKQQQGQAGQAQQQNEPYVVVLFPRTGASPQQGGAQAIQIELIESKLPQQQDGEQAGQPQGQAQPTGNALLFSSTDAQNGVVSYKLENAGNMSYRVGARSGGKMLKIDGGQGGQGVQVMTVKMDPSQQQMDQYKQQQEAWQQRQQAAAAQQKQEGEAQPAGSRQGGQAEQAPQQPTASDVAVILVYTGQQR